MKKLASPLTRIIRSVSKHETHSRLMLLALCISAMTLLTTHASAQTWQGDNDTSWTNAANWSSDPLEPQNAGDVTIGAAPNGPYLNTTTNFLNSLTITADTLITEFTNGILNSTTVTLSGSGSITNAGTINGDVFMNSSGSLNTPGAINGNLSISSGTTTITDTGDVSGSTSITGGVLNLNAGNFTSDITVSAGGTLQYNPTTTRLHSGALILNGGEVNYNATANNAQRVNGDITVQQESTINVGAFAGGQLGLIFNGNLLGNGVDLTVDANNLGVGLVLKGAANSFDGTILVQGTANSSPGLGSGLAIGNTGMSLGITNLNILGTVELGDSNGSMGWDTDPLDTVVGIGALSGTGVVVSNMQVIGGTRTLSIGTSGDDASFSGQILDGTNNTLSLVKEGAGTQILSGANNYTGTTTVNAGTLQFATANSLYFGISANWTAANINVQSGATLALNLDDAGTDGFDLGSLNTLLTNLSVANSATEGLQGGATLALDTSTDVNNYFNVSFDIANSTGANGGPIALTKLGTGTLELSGNNTYDGETTVTEGTLRVSSNNGLGSTVGGTTVVDGARLRLDNVAIGNEALEINGNGTSNNGALYNNGTSSYAGQITAATDATINAGGGTLTLSGGLVKDGTILTLTGGGTININSVGISGASANSDLVVDGVTVNLDVANSYNGPTYVRNAGILNANVLGAMPNPNDIATRTRVIMDDLGAGGSQLNLDADQTIASLTGAASSLVDLDVNTLTIGQTGAPVATFAGVISGAGGLEKRNNNIQILSGQNTYTGDTTIFNGTLRAGAGANGQAFGDNSAVTIDDQGSATLDLNNTNQTIGSLAGDGSVTLGSGTLTTGGNDSDTYYNGVISGSGGLIKTGSGTFSLDNQNTYTGATTISEGIVEVYQNEALGTNAAGTTVANGASLALSIVNYSTAEALTITGTGVLGGGALANVGGGSSTYAGQITVLNGASIHAGGGTLTLTGGIVKDGTTLTLTGGGNIIVDSEISGASANSDLIVDGVTVDLNNANTYNGPTYIRSTATDTGIINANVFGALPNPNDIATRTRVIMDDSGFGGSELNLIGGFNQSIASLTGATTSLVNLDVNTLTIGQNGAPDATFAGVISGTGGLTKRNNNIQILSGENTYTGATIIFNGTLRAAGGNTNRQAFGDNSAVTIDDQGNATLDLNSTNQTIGSLAGNGSVTLGSGTLRTGDDNTNTTFDGVISGLGGSLIKRGTGTFTLSGTNTYTGATTINDGTLELTITGSTAAGSTVAVTTNGTLSGDGTVNGNATLTGNGIINFGAAGNIAGTLGVTGGNWNGLGSVTGVVTASGALNIFTIGAGANLTTTGGLNVTGGTIVGDVTSTITGSVNYTSNEFSYFVGVIDGLASTVTVNNNGTLGAGLVLTNTNTYGGLTTVTSGVLSVEGVGATIGNNANAIVSNLGTLALSGSTISQNIQITGSGSTNATNLGGPLGAINAYGPAFTESTITGLITLAGDASIVASAGNTLFLDGGVVKDGVTLTLTGGGTIDINNVGISGSSDNSDLIVDGVTVNENVDNSYNGPTFIVNGGILNTNAADALPTSNGRTALTMDDSGSGSSELNLIGGFDQSIASIAGPDVTSLVNLNDNTLTIGTASGTTDFAGVITGSGSLIKDGASTQILSGLLNNYSGTTTITGGTLQIDGYIESDVTIEGPGTLSGDGIINANVELTNGGFIDLGTTGPGVITGALDVTGTGGSWIGGGEVDGLVTVSSGLFTIGSGANLTAWSGVEVINAASIAAADATGTITGSLTYMSSALSTFQGVIAGNSDVTVDNESLNSGGGLILSGLNTYTGTTTVTSGYLEVTGAGTLGNDANAVIVSSTGTLALTGDASINQNIEIEGTGTENFGASPIYGALRADDLTESTVFGLVTLTGDASIVATAGSILNLDSGFDKDGVTATLTGGGTINVDGEISGVSANSDLIVDGATVNLNAGNTYNGPTFIVNAGILNTNAVGALPLAIRTALTMDDSGSGSSELNLIGGFDQEIASLAGAASSLVNLNDNTLTIGTAAGTTTFAGVISGDFGTGGLTKDGASIQVLSGTNTYSGATQINAGILRAGAAAGGQAFGNLSAVTLANVAGAALDLNNFNQTIGSLAGGGNLGGNVTLGTGTLTTGGNNASTSYAGIISGTGANALIKVGTGTFTLSGASTYTGTTRVNAGILQAGALASGQAFGSRSAVTLLDVTGVALDLNDFSQTIGSLTSASGVDGGNVTLGSGTLTIGAAAGTTTFAGEISGSGGITKDLASIQIFSGLNTYTGNTLVSAGTLRAGVATQAFGLGSAVTIANDATAILDLAGFSQTIGSLAGVGPNGSVTLGNGTLTTGGNNTSTTFAGTILANGGNGGLIKNGTGTFTLTGANDYTGATAVTAGVLNIRNATALGATTGGTSVDDGAALEIQGGITVGAEALTLNGTGIASGGALRNISGNNTYGGLITLGSAARINSDAGTLTLSNVGTITGPTFGLTVGGAGNTTINSIIGTTTGTLTKDGAGTLVLTGTSTYTGATTVTNGTLRAGAAAGGQAFGNRSAVTIANSATAILDLAGFSQTIGSLAGVGPNGSVTLGGGTLTIGTTGGSTDFAGVISGAGNLTKDGASTQVLSASNTYTGTTTVNAGTLVLSAAERLANTSDLVINGGELTFVNVETVDIFTQTGGILDFDVDHPGGVLVNCLLNAGVDNDLLIATTANLGGTINVNKQGVEFERGERAVLIDTTAIAGVTGTPDTFTHDYTDRIFLVVDTSIVDTLTPIGAADTVSLLGTGVTGQNGNLANIAGLNANQKAIANAINTNINLNGNILDTSVEMDQIAIFALGDCNSAPGANLDILSPEAYAGFTDYGVQTIKSYTTNALSMPAYSRDGSARTVRIPVGNTSEPMVSSGLGDSVTSVFAGYSHYSTGTESSINGADYDISSNGGILGVRHEVNRLTLGGFFAVDEGDVNSATLNSDVDAFLLGAIASYMVKPEMNLLVTGGITYGNYDFSGTRRSLGLVTFDDVGSDVIDIHAAIEGDAYNTDKIRVTPFLGFHYIKSETEAFTETGLGALTVAAHDYDAFFTEIGVKSEYQLNEKISLNGNLSFTHNLSGSDKSIGASLGGTPFAVSSPGLGDDILTIGLGAQFQVTEAIRLGINYRAEFNTDAEAANGLNIGGSYSF